MFLASSPQFPLSSSLESITHTEQVRFGGEVAVALQGGHDSYVYRVAESLNSEPEQVLSLEPRSPLTTLLIQLHPQRDKHTHS
jgi:hypothetical protein